MGRLKSLRPVLITVIVILTSYLIFSNWFILVKVPTDSMSPTIKPNSIVLATKTTDNIGRGDIVIFDSKEKDKLMIKRIVGLPGEHITVEGAYITADNEVYSYATSYSDEYLDLGKVPEDSYVLIGDNVANSLDSRSWENKFIFKNCIRGKVISIFQFNLNIDN